VERAAARPRCERASDGAAAAAAERRGKVTVMLLLRVATLATPRAATRAACRNIALVCAARTLWGSALTP
jgi:hypothetical protein